MRFPEVTGSNLLRRKVTLPDDLQGELNIVFIAFYQWHQALVDSSVPKAREIEQSHPDVRFYEIPVIRKMNFLSQTFISEGMRAGIPNLTTREKTITLYLDKKALRRALEIPNEETIRVLLLDRLCKAGLQERQPHGQNCVSIFSVNLDVLHLHRKPLRSAT